MKKLSVFISSLIAYLTFPLMAFATDPTQTPVNPCADATSGIAQSICRLNNNIGKTVQSVVVFFIIIAVVIALFYLLYGGVKWITSRGDKAEVEAARNHIMAAIIGLIVVFLAIFLISILLAAFGIQFNQLKIPVIGE